MFLSDYPRTLANCLRLWRFPAFHALAIAPALAVAPLLATPRLPVLLLCLPPRPLPRPPPTLGAAIALARLPRMKTVLTPLEQTMSFTRLTCPALLPGSRLIFCAGVQHSRKGPWEVITPRSSCPGGEATPLRGAVNLRLIAKSPL